MTQLQAIATDEQIIAQQELNQYTFTQANAIAKETPGDSFDKLAHATQNILTHALWLAQQKEHLSKSEYRKLLKHYGWKAEDRRYLKVATAFKHFSSQDLAQIEPATLFRLANNSKKYQSIIDQLQNLTEINQLAVRDLIAKQRQPKEPKPEQPSIWRRTKNGGRYCQIPPIHESDERTGTTLQHMMESEGLTAQRVIAEAIALRQAYIEGRLVLVEQAEQATVIHEITYDLDNGVSADNANGNEYGEDIEFERLNEDEELLEGTWTYESAPEKDDWTVESTEYAVLTQSNDEQSQPERTVSIPIARSPVEELIEMFQSANTWEQIREALAVHKDYKQQAWEALTPVEKKRVKGLMPQEVKKLREAQKAGLIVDFQELREGVYQVRRMGNVLGEVVSSSRLDAFLDRLQAEWGCDQTIRNS